MADDAKPSPLAALLDPSSLKRLAVTGGVATTIATLPLPERWEVIKPIALMLLGLGEVISSRWLDAQIANAEAAGKAAAAAATPEAIQQALADAVAKAQAKP